MTAAGASGGGGRGRVAVVVAVLAMVAAAMALPSLASAAAGLNWSSPRVIDTKQPFENQPDLGGLACPSTTLCVAAYGDHMAVSTDPTGGRSDWIPVGVPGNGVACPSTSLCVAVADNQASVSTDPTGGASAWQTDTNDGEHVQVAVACPSTTLCVSVDHEGDVDATTDPAGGGATWHAATVDARHAPTSIACPSTTLCVGADTDGNVFTSTNPTGGASAWTVIHVGGGYLQVSCPSIGLCVAGGSAGFLASSSNPAGGAGAWSGSVIDTSSSNDLPAISCPTVTLCVSDDGGGNLVTSHNPAGGAHAWTVSFATIHFQSLACPTATLCVGGNGGNIQSSPTPTVADSWTTRAIAGSNSLSALACVTASLCLAGDTSGNLLISTHPATGRWRQTSFQHAVHGSQGDGDASIYGLQCVSRVVCLAVVTSGQPPASPGQGGGYLYSFNPKRIPASVHREKIRVPHNGDGLPPIDGLNCPTRARCYLFTETGVLLSSATPVTAASWRRAKGSLFPESTCTSTTKCFATGSAGRIVPLTVGHNGHVSRGSALDIDGGAPLNGLACGTGGLCAATDASGNLLSSTHPATASSWGHSTIGDTEPGGLACFGARLCLAGDSDGQLYVGTPSSPQRMRRETEQLGAPLEPAAPERR